MLTVAVAELAIAVVEGLVLAWLIWEIRSFRVLVRELGEQARAVSAAIDEARAAADSRPGRHAALGRHAVSPPVDHESYGQRALNGAAPRPGG